MATGIQKRNRSERVAALELPPGLVERTFECLQRGDVLAMGLRADLAQTGHLSGIGRRGEGHHGACLGHLVGNGQDRCPAE